MKIQRSWENRTDSVRQISGMKNTARYFRRDLPCSLKEVGVLAWAKEETGSELSRMGKLQKGDKWDPSQLPTLVHYPERFQVHFLPKSGVCDAEGK